MPDPILDPLNVTTQKEIYPTAIEDLFFLNTPFQAHLRAKALYPFDGGAFMQNDFAYAPLIGGAYQPGDSFNINVVDILSACVFDPKYYQVSLAEYLENILVTNKGKAAVFSIVNTKLRVALNTISAIVGNAINRHGQPSGGGVVGNRIKQLNGWIEAMNDGWTPGWEGSIFPNYGTQARNGVIGDALNSTPYWGGNQDGSPAPITYPTIEENYQTSCRGNEEPDIGVGNKAIFASIKERIQVQQVYQQQMDPYFGVMGFKINKATFIKDDYFPSLKYGRNDPRIGNSLTGTYVSPAANQDGSGTAFVTRGSNMPASTTLTVGEVFCFFNTAKWLFRIANNEEFGYGWTGFLRAQDGTRVAGQVKAMNNLQCLAPWANLQSFGYSS